MKYRAEIDGLRAIAVAPVILFHAGFSSFAGGFVGVDVFFVISGFLITALLLSELEEGRFSFARFYERRARRLAPALFVVMLACIPFAWAWMLPSQFMDFAASLFSITVFLSNFYFLSQVEYFQPAAELQPMLHTWSLSIEEQYYLLFPAFLVLAIKAGRTMVLALILLFVAGGIYLSHVGVTDDPGKNYFHSAARLWEIGAGSLLAFLPQRRNLQPWDDALALTGLALIALSVVLFDKATPFPGLWALLPVGGTMLVLRFSSSGTRVGKVLSLRPVVGLGLISYSAYLWHQPVFAFARLRSLDPPGIAQMWLLIGLTLILAWASWRFVEYPFRKGPRKLLPSRRGYMLSVLAVMAVIGTGGVWSFLQEGFPERMHNGVSLAGFDDRLRPNTGLADLCEGGFTLDPRCSTSEAPTVLVWGDSYAMHLVPGLIAAQPDIGLRQHTQSACSPVLGLAFVQRNLGAEAAERCFAFNTSVLADLKATPGIDTVILSSRFPLTTHALWRDSGQVVPDDAVSAALAEALRQTVEAIRQTGAKVVMVSPPPTAPHDLGQCAAKALRFGAPLESCDFPPDQRVNAPVFDFLDQISDDVQVLRLDTALCADGICDTIIDQTLIYRDEGHLSREGSRALADTLGAALAN